MKLFDNGMLGSNSSYVVGNTNYVSGNTQLDLVQGEVGKSLSSVSGAIDSLSNNVCYAQISKSVNTLSVGTNTAIILDTAPFDKFGLYDSTTGGFTSPITGVISFTLCLGIFNPTNVMRIYAVKNNKSNPIAQIGDPEVSSLVYGSATYSNYDTINVTWYCPVNRGDVIVFVNNGGTFNTSYNNAQITMKW